MNCKVRTPIPEQLVMFWVGNLAPRGKISEFGSVFGFEIIKQGLWMVGDHSVHTDR